MKCLLCFEENLVEILNLGRQPLANKYPKKEQFATEEFFPMPILFCPRCKNVQLGTIISRERMFIDYYYLSSVNPGLVRHFQELAKKISNAKFVVDIGSNDGILLRPLKELGVKVIGVDPSVNVGKIANDSGLTTIVSFFDQATAERIAEQYGKPDVVVASSIFTHLENPHQFIEDVKQLIDEDGEFIIEVEYIGNILKEIQFERFYLDRIFYYSLTSLKHLFEKHNMYLYDVEAIIPHGGSLRVVARNRSHYLEPKDSVRFFIEEEKDKLTPVKLENFRQDVDKNIKNLREVLVGHKSAGLRVAGYGAPARVATICNYGGIGPSLIEFIVDDSPLKQDRFSPGTHIPIVPKNYLDGHKPDILVVFAYEYFDDIKKKIGGGYRYYWPIPTREVI